MDILQQVFSSLFSTPNEVIITVLGVTGVTILTQLTKVWLEIEKNRYAILVSGAFSFLAAGIQYLVTANNLPPEILGFNTLAIVALANPVYHWIIKPLNIFISNYNDLKAKAEQITQTSDTTTTTPEVIAPVALAPAATPSTEIAPAVAPVAAVPDRAVVDF